MRTEQEIIDLVLKVAREDSRVRAVGMNGSRTNPNVPKDPFRDYDIVYVVTDMQSFLDEPGWVDVFGERIIMQTPEAMELFPNELGNRFSYLMLFTDGSRIDLILVPLEEKLEYSREDGLTVILLDKDQDLPVIPPPTDREYWVQKPSPQCFADCCNEFWWTSTYVAKGLWRQEILYALDHLNLVRAMLLKMLEWKVGFETGFSLSIGKNAKFLDRYVDQNTWERLLETYPPADYKRVWNSLFKMWELFEESAAAVAEHLNEQYLFAEAEKVRQYLRRVQQLKPDAKEID